MNVMALSSTLLMTPNGRQAVDQGSVAPVHWVYRSAVLDEGVY